ncbi:MAG: hypothetical protein KDM63_15975 [Verrucomicrobiae bacterium]|nr:hypothetical protein [Verrucomicrobiae bacterium]MCB1088535.1 hypothetical protein [Verrucomicrobiae bacterium]
MKWLSNHPDAFELVNLRWHESGHGPYLIRQDGCPPCDDRVPPEGRYFLQKDGTWLLNVTFCNLSRDAQSQGLYNSIQEVFAIIETLDSHPKVDSTLPEGMSHEALISGMSQTAREFLDKSHHYPSAPLSAYR